MENPTQTPEELEKEQVEDAGEFPPTTLERDDNRWGRGAWLRDWVILLIMIIVYLTWTGILFLFEPGIR